MKLYVRKIFCFLLVAVLAYNILCSYACGLDENTARINGLDVSSNAIEASSLDPLGSDNGVNLFVATDGSDDDDGSFEHPFQTLIRANQEVMARRISTPTEAITVNIRGGEYYSSESIYFSEHNSGTTGAPVTWQAYNGENVLISGGIPLGESEFQPVTDQSILSRVPDSGARSKLLCFDYSGYLNEWPDPIDYDSGYGVAVSLPHIYVGETPLTQARWPNDVQNQAYVYADHAQALGEGDSAPIQITSTSLAQRAESWSLDAWENMYIHSFIAHDWAEAIFDVASFDAQAGELVTSVGYWDVPTENARFYVFNLLEEIDVPGEYYIDYTNKMIYFYPPQGFEQEQVYLSTEEHPLFSAWEAHDITLRGLTFSYSRAHAFQASQISNITFDGCTISHTTKAGIVMYEATNCAVKNSHIYDNEDGAVHIWGDAPRKSLTSSENVIENNHFHHNNRVKKCSNAVRSEGCGAIIRNNEFHHESGVNLFLWSANDSIVEYNDFHDTCLDVSDTGAIYYGLDPSVLGVVIRYNSFRDIGSTYGGTGQQGIFCDDGAMMPYIYGNLFVNASDQINSWDSAVKAHGAQFGVIRNNIFVDSPVAAYLQHWNFEWDSYPYQDRWISSVYGTQVPEYRIWQRITEDVDVFSDLWQDHYKDTQWAQLWDYITPEGYAEAWQQYNAAGEPPNYDPNSPYYQWAYDNAPSYTTLLAGNVCVNIGELFQYNGRNENNLMLTTGIFKNYESGNFALTDQALAQIRTAIPDFEKIPLESIGRNPTVQPNPSDNSSGFPSSGSGDDPGDDPGDKPGDNSSRNPGGSTQKYSDQAVANAVIALVDGIGEITAESEPAIKAARVAYDALTDAQKALVTNYSVLTAAEKSFNALDDKAPSHSGSMPFTDVKEGQWFYEAVRYAYENGLFTGMTPSTFEPDTNMTRGMLVTVLFRYEGEPGMTVNNEFSDVAAGRYYEKAIIWAAEKGIVNGYNATTFGPEDNITREQTALILYNYAKYKGKDVSAITDLAGYTDAKDISPWSLTAMKWANAEKMMVGRTNTTLVPKGDTTRAEAAMLLMKFIDNIIG